MPSEYLSDRPLLKIIREEIRAAGRIPFARYMELCLYHPEYGYYNTARPKLGSAGDFYTNAHLSPVFAQLIARHLVTTWEELSKPRQFLLVELGAGDGAFARTFLDCVAARYPELQAALSYIAVEQGAASRALLMDAIANHDRATAVAALEELPPPAPRPGCIFANEFFDALPLHILSREEGSWREHSICLEGERLA